MSKFHGSTPGCGNQLQITWFTANTSISMDPGLFEIGIIRLGRSSSYTSPHHFAYNYDFTYLQNFVNREEKCFFLKYGSLELNSFLQKSHDFEIVRFAI